MEKISVSLTQFLDFTLKRSGVARTKFVREMKYNEYHPATDYWKQLRDEIVKVHSHNYPLDQLDNLVLTVNDRKKNNYKQTIKLYKKYFLNKELKWFNPGNSSWTFNNELLVRSNPELGLYIDGVPHLIKLYFKGEKERIDQHNISSALTLMNSATFSETLPDDVLLSVLNIRRKKIYQNNFLDNDLLLSLEGDAQQLIHLWKNV